MDITEFFTWFMEQFIRILTYCINVLNDIKINGISLLMIILTIAIIGTIIPIIMTIPNVEKVKVIQKERTSKNDNKSK